MTNWQYTDKMLVAQNGQLFCDFTNKGGCVVSKDTVRPARKNYESLETIRILNENFGKDAGLLHEACITGKKVDFGRCEWSLLAHDQFLFSRVRRLVDAYAAHHGWIPEEIREAINILGPQNVFHHYDVAGAWSADFEKWEWQEKYRFTENWHEVLEKCAEENEDDVSRWVLVFHLGLSIAEQARRTGWHSHGLLAGYGIGFKDPDNVVKMAANIPALSETCEQKYYLLNFKSPLNGLTPEEHKRRALVMKDRMIANPAVITEAILSANRLMGETLIDQESHFHKNVIVSINYPSDTMGDEYLQVQQIKEFREPIIGAVVEREFQCLKCAR